MAQSENYPLAVIYQIFPCYTIRVYSFNSVGKKSRPFERCIEERGQSFLAAFPSREGMFIARRWYTADSIPLGGKSRGAK